MLRDLGLMIYRKNFHNDFINPSVYLNECKNFGIDILHTKIKRSLCNE